MKWKIKELDKQGWGNMRETRLKDKINEMIKSNRKNRSINWGLILPLFCLSLFWIFIWFMIYELTVLKGHIQIYNANKDWETVMEIKRYEYKIAMFREKYWCPADAETCNTIVDIANEYGVDGQVVINLGWCESNLQPIPGKINKRDRGWFQINSRYHPEISDECAYNLECSANFTAKKISKGKGYLWVCWK